MNYDNINDIFAAGVTNMTCLLQDSNNYDGGTLAVSGADFFTFLGKAAPSIYAHGDSYWGIGSDVIHLKIDNRDTRMRSLYREEGTLYSYYRFLKIRWEGWSHYNASGADYQLKYDLVFWDTGDISLHMISVPVQCYDGVFGFAADKNYTFTKPDADSPDITFQYYVESKMFEIKYRYLNLRSVHCIRILMNRDMFYITPINVRLMQNMFLYLKKLPRKEQYHFKLYIYKIKKMREMHRHRLQHMHYFLMETTLRMSR